jgi:predicted nucleic acid-binding Zn ribbon protein
MTGEGMDPEPEAGTADEVAAEDHRDDGLDLARALSRASARTGPAKRPRKPKPDRPRARTGRVSGAHPDERDPQPLDLTLNRVVDDRGWDLDLRVHGVFGRWTELVGDDVGAHCTPESFDEGRLVVRTDSTAWATQLRLLAPRLVRRLADELGDGIVTQVTVQGPRPPSWGKGPWRVRGRGPRDTYG